MAKRVIKSMIKMMKNIKQKLRQISLIVCSILFLIGSVNGFASNDANNSINTFSITADTLAALPSCVHYKIVGQCFWLVCESIYCRVERTNKVDHYLPDVVVTTYPGYKKDPWFEVNATIDVASHATGNAIFKSLNNGMEIKKGVYSSANSSDSDTKLNEVNVIGNPALMAVGSMGNWLLKGQVTPYMPYFQSQLDATEWRSGLSEQLYPQSWIPGKGDVGTFILNEWGSIYPRQGFIIQPNVGKAAAVMAVRGANIASTHSIDYVFSQDFAAKPCPEHDCTVPGKVTNKSPKTQWQMILPNKQTICHKRIDYDGNPSWTKHQKDDQSFAWVVWREYRGCIDDPDGSYIGSITWG